MVRSKADIIRELEGLAGRLNASDRAVVEEIAADLAMRNKRKRSDSTAERNKAIVAAYRGGQSLREVAKRFGVTGQRVHQIINALPQEEIDQLWKDRQQTEEDRKNAELWAKVEERVAQATVCPVCQGWNLRGPKRKTCSPECAKVWSSGGARFILDETEYERRRLAQAKSILRHYEDKTKTQIAWAHRVIAGEAPPNRRYHVPGSKASEIVARFAPDKLPGKKKEEGDTPIAVVERHSHEWGVVNVDTDVTGRYVVTEECECGEQRQRGLLA